MTETGEESPAQWAIDLLTKDSGYRQSIISRYLPEVSCAAVGFVGAFARNFATRRPLNAALHYYIITTLGGAAIGAYISKITAEQDSYRDGLYIDYIKRHPERFPEPDYDYIYASLVLKGLRPSSIACMKGLHSIMEPNIALFLKIL